MAAYVRVILLLFCSFLVEGHVLPRRRHSFGSPRSHKPLSVGGIRSLFTIKPNWARTLNGNLFSYNIPHNFDDFYDPNIYSYFEYPDVFDRQNFDNMPLAYPNIVKGYHKPPNINDYINSLNGDKISNADKDTHEKRKDNQKPDEPQDDTQLPDVDKSSDNTDSPKLNQNNEDDLNPKKDFLLVGDGHNVFLLHENTPNTNGMFAPNNVGNNVVYVPVNPQQPNNQFPNVPITIPNNVANNMPVNNNNPSYVLVYANGQLIQIPGVVLNSQPNVANGNPGMNAVNTNMVSTPNVIYVTQPNQGNNPLVLAIPNNPTGNGNGYVQPNGNDGNPVIANPVRPADNQPNLPVNNGRMVFSNAQDKDANAGTPAPNNVPVVIRPGPDNNAVINPVVAQPAIMVSGFKENDGSKKDEKKEEMDTEDTNKGEDEKEKESKD